jgi:hypothetical protein
MGFYGGDALNIAMLMGSYNNAAYGKRVDYAPLLIKIGPC